MIQSRLQQNRFDFLALNVIQELNTKSDLFFFVSLEMQYRYLILWAVAGGALAYVVYYLQYQHRDVVWELRKNLKGANDQILYLQGELDELSAQNELFRDKSNELLKRNDELSDVVAELGKYYVHIKKAAEKTSELSKFLHDPNPEIEDKLSYYIKSESPREEKKNFF